MPEQIVLDGCRPVLLDDVEMADGAFRPLLGVRGLIAGARVDIGVVCVNGDEANEGLP